MSGLVARTTNKGSEEISILPFWPTVSVKELRDQYRIYSSITNDACLQSLKIAYITVTDALDEYAAQKEQEGITALEKLERESERFRQVTLFKQAIYSLAKQKISEEYIDVDLTRKAGSDRREAVNNNTLALNADYNMAIRKFLDKPASFVALI